MIREREYGAMSGWGALVVIFAGAAFFIWQLIVRAQADQKLLVVLSVVGLLFCGFLALGLFVVNPNEGKVLQLFGSTLVPRSCRTSASPIRSTRRNAFRSAYATSRAPS